MPRVCRLCSHPKRKKIDAEISNNEFYVVYGIKPKGGDYFYVGSTTKGASVRFRQHIADVRKFRHTNAKFTRKVREHGVDNIEIQIIECTTPENLLSREYFWINHFISIGYDLANIVISEKQAESFVKKYRKETIQDVILDCLALIMQIIQRNLSYEKRSSDHYAKFFEIVRNDFSDNDEIMTRCFTLEKMLA